MLPPPPRYSGELSMSGLAHYLPPIVPFSSCKRGLLIGTESVPNIAGSNLFRLPSRVRRDWMRSPLGVDVIGEPNFLSLGSTPRSFRSHCRARSRPSVDAAIPAGPLPRNWIASSRDGWRERPFPRSRCVGFTLDHLWSILGGDSRDSD